MDQIPNPNQVFPNQYGTTCFIKNVISAPNILNSPRLYGQYKKPLVGNIEF